jgi:hypothetical protein
MLEWKWTTYRVSMNTVTIELTHKDVGEIVMWLRVTIYYTWMNMNICDEEQDTDQSHA